jgi:butyryl-CoA dehydrogenase
VNLELTEEQKLLQRSVRKFAEADVRPLAKELDETGQFPRETLRKAAELGLTGISVPEKYGGAGMDHICYSIVMEEIARVCASTSVILSVQNSLYCTALDRFGTEAQKQNFLVPFARGGPKRCARATIMWSTEPRRGLRMAA